MSSQKKIKVLFRHRSMEMGGVEKVIISHLENLDQEKFAATILLSIDQGELRNHIPPHVKKLAVAKGRESFSTNKLIQKAQLVARKIRLDRFRKKPYRIDQNILKDKFDVEIASTYGDFEMVLNSSNKKSKKIGWLHSDITLPKLQPLVPTILKQIPQFDYMLYGAQQNFDILRETYPDLPLPPGQALLNPVPIKEIIKKSQEFSPERGTLPLFISVNRLHSRKGFDKLIDAHVQLLKEGFEHEIWIIGDGDERQNLENLIRQKNIESSFKLLGTKVNPYPYMKVADFFIMPSESEGRPLVINDALLLKKPIIATKVGGIPEMIAHEKTGYLINYDTAEIISAMKKFLTEKEYIATLSENLKDSETFFDNEKIYKTLEDIIVSLAKS